MKHAVLVLLLGITACSHTTPIERGKQSFHTKIGDDGSKTFIYGIELSPEVIRDTLKSKQRELEHSTQSRSQRGEQSKRQSPSSRRGSNNNVFGLDKKSLQRQLDLLLQKNQYCREGYIELDSFIDKTSAHFRGECNDSATEADRKKFAHLTR
ncbi:hypothetical protein [Thalassotalea fusca]